MKGIIPVLGMMGTNIFFVLASLIGYKYVGVEDSKVYILYNILIAILNMLIFINYFIFNKRKIVYKDLIILGIPIFALFSYFVGIMINNGINKNEMVWFLYFFLWSTPAIYGAFTVSKEKINKDVIKWIEVVTIIFSLNIIIVTITSLLLGSRAVGFGGSTNQNSSYISALAYGLSLYFYNFGQNHDRFKFTKNKVYKIIIGIMILTNFIGTILYGGRGAFVLIIAYSMLIFIYSLKKLDFNKIIKILIMIVIIRLLFPILSQSDLFMNGYNRAIAFINPSGGINWQGTSNRDIVYKTAIFFIKEKPFLGYGLFGYWKVMPNPHNIFLEVLLSGGLVYLFIFIALLSLFFLKLFRMMKYDQRNRIWLFIFIYPFIMLMFSGSYLVSSEFWFIISLVATYKLPFKTNNYKKIE